MKLLKQRLILSKADIHIHSNFSDGHPSIQEILDYVEQKTDLAVIAITDHDTIEGALLAQKLLTEKKYRFEVVVGEEVTSKEGHILGLFLKKPVAPGQSAHDTISDIRKQGGIAIAAHPFYHTRMNNSHMIIMDGVGMITLLKERSNLHGIETINATPTLGGENIRAHFINDTVLFLTETGGSDAHIVDAIGKGHTLFEGKTAEDLKKALETGQTRSEKDRWSLFSLLRYGYFFIPIGFRILFHTLAHGKSKKRSPIINFTKK